MTDTVLFDEHSCINNKIIAIATLNSPKTLNALNLTMVKLLLEQLQQWRDNPKVALVVIQGRGDKAFCAGGDIKHLYHQLNDNPGEYTQDVMNFFANEYKLDYLIHSFKKPVMVLGSGIVMGGGMGLFIGASHRVVDESTRMAMPEISIGLFPDVGASWFLSRLEAKIGLLLGLCGANINAGDAKYLGLGDHFITKDKYESLLEKLLAVGWGDTVALNHEKLSTFLNEFEGVCKLKMPKSDIRSHQDLLNELVTPDDIVATVDNILATSHESEWFKSAQENLRYGSPLSASIIQRQLSLGAQMSLEECFKMELTLALKSAQFGEFGEGVRALLVDKDRQPNWKYKHISDVEPSTLNWFFESLWHDHEHPLMSIASE